MTGGNFNTGFSADSWAEYCGDFTLRFEVRGGELRGTLKMDGDVPSDFSVRGRVLSNGSLEDVRAEGVFEIKFYGTRERGHWELETCSGTFVAQRGASTGRKSWRPLKTELDAKFGGAKNFDGNWIGAGKLMGGNFSTGFSADAWAEYCGDFTVRFEVRGGDLRGKMKMDGDVASDYTVRGSVLSDGSLEDARGEGPFEVKLTGAHLRGYWELETCRGTYVAWRGGR